MMAKLSKAVQKKHDEACKLLRKSDLTINERWFVIENWQESATHMNGKMGAFFTPIGLAFDFELEVSGPRILDLCAGIGTLSFACQERVRTSSGANAPIELVCVENNPDYCTVGKKLVPEATWHCGDVLDVDFIRSLGKFDCVISNPPFGRIEKTKAPRYAGSDFEYKIMDIASDVADCGVFIIPQMSASFAYSGKPCMQPAASDKHQKFTHQTGIKMGPSLGIDCDYHRNEWRGVSPAVEIVVCDFEEAQAGRQTSLFISEVA